MKRTFKKTISLVLAVLLAFASLPLVGASAACTHVFDGYTTAPDGSGHFSSCSKCFAVNYGTFEACSGGAATCAKGAICSKCGNEYTAKSDSHGTAVLRATAEYLSKEATCKYPAYYYLSCYDCGAKYEDMTLNADNVLNPNNHQFVYGQSNGNRTHNAKCALCEADKKNVACKDAEPVVTGATCTAGGKKVHTCDVCSYSWEEPISALGHKFDKQSNIKRSEATCTAYETYWYMCSNAGCTVVANATIAPDKYYSGTHIKAHQYNAKKTDAKFAVKLANCQQVGEYYYSCDNCDAKDTTRTFTTTKGNHVWNAGVSNGDAKCGVDGTKTVTCTICGEVSTTEPDPGSALEHNFNREVESADRLETAGNCIIANIYYYTCANCDVWSTKSTDRFIGKTHGPHNFLGEDLTVIMGLANGTDYVKSVATCQSKALFYKYCLVCKASSKGTDAEGVFSAGDIKPHDYQAITNDKFIRVNATCVDGAIYTVSCVACETPKIPEGIDIYAPGVVVNPEDVFFGSPLGHDLKSTKAYKDSTCVIEGNYEEFTCQRVHGGQPCGFKAGGETIPKKDHVYKVTQEYRAPTCKINGQYGQKKCEGCGVIVYLDANGETANILTQNMAATGHSDTDGDMICEKCDALLEAADLCTCICHKGESGGLMYFVIWILKWFWKMTNQNQTCACGQAHY